MALKVPVLAHNLKVCELLLLEAGVEVQAHGLAHHNLLLLLHLVADVSHLTSMTVSDFVISPLMNSF